VGSFDVHLLVRFLVPILCYQPGSPTPRRLPLSELVPPDVASPSSSHSSTTTPPTPSPPLQTDEMVARDELLLILDLTSTILRAGIGCHDLIRGPLVVRPLSLSCPP
jgi:hypothetical protein